MNHHRTFFLVSALAALAGAALAQPGSGWTHCGHGVVDCDPLTTIESTLTRKEVRAELERAQREGRIVNGSLAVLHDLLHLAPEKRSAPEVQQAPANGGRP